MPLFLPSPCIIPKVIPVLGEKKRYDTNTKIEMLCETKVPDVEVYYTLDGTKPQPYAGIIQGSKLMKYVEPFCLPSGKNTIKAIAIHSYIRSMCSNVVTKTYYVFYAEPTEPKKKPKLKKRKPRKTLRSPKDGCVKLLDQESMSPHEAERDEEDLPETMVANENDAENLNMSNVSTETYVIETNGENGNIHIEVLENLSILSQEADECIEEKDFPCKDNASEDVPIVSHTTTCANCEVPLQHCTSCNKVNSIFANYCDKCGKKLIFECSYCKEQNPSIAIFCQYCGKKLNADVGQRSPKKICSVNQSVMAKPKMKDFDSQKSSHMKDAAVQTTSVSDKRKSAPIPDVRKLPPSTPGRGYWRQQVDYICNHLKAHAYNNLDFRKEIGEPSLHQFLSADIGKSDDDIVVTIHFSSIKAVQENAVNEGVVSPSRVS